MIMMIKIIRNYQMKIPKVKMKCIIVVMKAYY